ncbi:transposable element p transposase [Plakobranchus ocellatus]|uniref:Transposable element p transposase n=1 Tax=Plakobranchus ocellatus TaxID=259542 RepID=A0AAV4B5D0_9GAST|nr:transposable element p transposase [Plakobranchus ocellatus]
MSRISTTSPLESPAVSGKSSHLIDLYEHETNTMIKLSQLSKASVYPSNIERQKVTLVLNVFSEKTSATKPEWKETAAFIDQIVKLWKVFNTINYGRTYIRFQDADSAPIDLSRIDQSQLNFLSSWSEIALSMTPEGQRVKTLTKDTAKALHWTCKCLVAMSQYLLTTASALYHQYLVLVFFQQDDLEHHFAHFRMSAGSNYYKTAEDVAHTHAMDRAKLFLQMEPELNYVSAHHECDHCDKCPSDSEILILDDLPESINNISRDEKMSLFFIGGYTA